MSKFEPWREVGMLELMLGLLVATAVSGILPLVNAELVVIGAAATVSGVLVPWVAVVSAAGQMATKTLLFALARWLPSRLSARARRSVDRASEMLRARGGAAGSVVFASAAVGLPPFYGVSLACGALGMGFPAFLVTGMAGRTVRFGVLAWAGHRFGGGAVEALREMGLPSFLLGG